MSEWRTIQVDAGLARSPREAWVHATFSSCPGDCGKRPSSMGILEPEAGFVYRLAMRCRHCKLFIHYDYREADRWYDNQERSPLELAGDPVTSLLPIEPALEALLEARRHWLDLPRPDAQDLQAIDQWRAETHNAAADSLAALLELAKLKAKRPDGQPAGDAQTRAMAALYVETGGELPASLDYLLREEPVGFDVRDWLQRFFTDREAFNRTRLEGLDSSTDELVRASIAGVLESFSRHVDSANRHADEIAKLRAEPSSHDRSKSAVLLLEDYGLLEAVDELLRNMRAATANQSTISQAWLSSNSAILQDRFADFGYYQRVLLQAISIYQQLTEDDSDMLIAAGEPVAYGPYLELLQRACRNMPAWPPMIEDPVGSATALEAASEAINELLKRVDAGGQHDR